MGPSPVNPKLKSRSTDPAVDEALQRQVAAVVAGQDEETGLVPEGPGRPAGFTCRPEPADPIR